MAIRTRDELMTSLQGILGDNSSDEALALVEDLNDTLNNNDGTDWKNRYEENDKQWRERYRNRFFNGGQGNEPEPDEPDPEPVKKPMTFDDLFKEE